MTQQINVNNQQLKLLATRTITSKEKLDQFLRVFFGVYLASTPIEDGNSSPLDFVWDIYSTAMDLQNDPVYSFVGMAGRGTQKTLAFSVVETLLLGHNTRSIFSMASIAEQAKISMAYTTKFLQRPFIKDFASKPPLKGLIDGANGNILKIGSATMDQVNSFHGSVFQDEIELTDEAVFKEARGMLTAEKGKIPLSVYISSRKFSFGNLQKLLDQAELEEIRSGKPNIKIHKWGILEATERCQPERSGNLKTTPIYVDNENLLAIPEAAYEMLGTKQKFAYKKQIGHDGCLNCGIFSFCLGRLVNQRADNPYLQPIQTTKDHFLNDDTVFFKSQRLNRRPSQIGIVYSMFDETIHIKNYTQMVEICTGEKPNKVYSRDDFIAFTIENGGALFVGVDFGWHVAATVLMATGPKDKMFVVAEKTYSRLTHKELALAIIKEWGKYPIERVFPDYESQEGIKQLRELGLPVPSQGDNVNKDRIEGVSMVRNLLRIPGTLDSNLYISTECPQLKEEMRYYRHKIDKRSGDPTDEIEDGNDHLCFIAGTKIKTNDGDKNIEDLKIGDLVLTREGCFPIENKIISEDKETISVIFSNGETLIGTPDHPIFSKGIKIRLDSLRYADIVDSWQTLVQTPTFIDPQEILGVKKMARFLKGTIFTIKMRIQGIMNWIISNAFQNQTTFATIGSLGMKTPNERSKYSRIWTKPDLLLLNGMDQKKELNGIGNMLWRKDLENGSRKILNASFVIQILNLLSFQILNFVRINVNLLVDVIPVLMMKLGFVSFATKLLRLTDILKLKIVQKHVPLKFVAKTVSKKQTVYNLSIKDVHEYFANGILVSNCDASRYIVSSIFGRTKSKISFTTRKEMLADSGFVPFDPIKPVRPPTGAELLNYVGGYYRPTMTEMEAPQPSNIKKRSGFTWSF